MNGVIALDSRSGRHIYSHAYEEKFGMRDQRVVDSLTLSSLIFALYINAEECQRTFHGEEEEETSKTAKEEEAGRSERRREARKEKLPKINPSQQRRREEEKNKNAEEESETEQTEREEKGEREKWETKQARGSLAPALASLESGESRIVFRKHKSLDVLVAVFFNKKLRHDLGEFIADEIVERFVSKFEPLLRTSAASQRPLRKIGGFSSVLHSIFQTIPPKILSEIGEALEPLSGSCPWLYCFSSKPFFEVVEKGIPITIDEGRYGTGFRFGKQRKLRANKFKFSYGQKKRKRAAADDGREDICTSGPGIHLLYSFVEEQSVQDEEAFMEAMRRVIFECSRLLRVFSPEDDGEQDSIQSLELELSRPQQIRVLLRRFGHVIISVPLNQATIAGTVSLESLFFTPELKILLDQLLLSLSFLERSRSSLPSIDLNGRGNISHVASAK